MCGKIEENVCRLDGIKKNKKLKLTIKFFFFPIILLFYFMFFVRLRKLPYISFIESIIRKSDTVDSHSWLLLEFVNE